jgi:PAS domain S-box-containing protein
VNNLEKNGPFLSRTSKMLLDQILFYVPAAIFWKDLHGVYLGCNELFLKMAGLNDPSQIVGLHDSELPWADRDQDYNQDDFHVIQTGETIKRVEPVSCAEGEIIANTTKVPWYENDKIIGVLCVIHEITDLVRAKEAAEAASQSKSEFITNMSHDLRTPLSGIVNIASGLAAKALVPEEKEQLELMHNGAKQLLAFLDNVLDMASADAAHETVSREKVFDLRVSVGNICALLSPNIKVKNLNFILEIDPKLPQYIYGNQVKLERILLNLLGNAIKFTEKGSITLRATAMAEEGTIIQVKWTVADTGIGIPLHEQEKIFDHFFRASPAYKGLYTGNGVGLCIAQKFVESLGGDKISVASQVGEYTEFNFTLPMTIGDPVLLEQQSYPPPTPWAVRPEPYSVLLVEDTRISQMAAKIILEESNCFLDYAATGEEALKKIVDHSYELVFMDIGLPDISGTEITSFIRQREHLTPGKRIPIIGLSAHIDYTLRQEAYGAGMDEVLIKPISREQVREMLMRFCAKEPALSI